MLRPHRRRERHGDLDQGRVHEPVAELIDGIRWRTRTGSPWRDVREQYGAWQSVDGLFRRWQLDGTWAVIVLELQALADDAGHVTWDVSVDSGTARAHQHAAGARKNPGPRGQGVRVARQPEVPAPPRDPLHHPREEGPAREPEE